MEVKMIAREDIEIGQNITPNPIPPLSFSPSTSTSTSTTALRLLDTVHHQPPPSTSSHHRISGLLTNHHWLMSDPPTASYIRECVSEIDNSVKKYDSVLVESVVCLVMTNGVEVVDERSGRAAGVAVFGPGFSWINHSCRPNACYSFLFDDEMMDCVDHDSGSSPLMVPVFVNGDGNVVCESCEMIEGGGGGGGGDGRGPKVVVRSIRRIKKGEEVTVAYTDLLQPKEMRQSELWSKFRFFCTCERCSASPPSYVDHSLQEISASNLDSSSLNINLQFCKDEATKKLTEFVDLLISEFLISDGDPKSSCEKLENMLINGLSNLDGASQLLLRLNPFHHLALSSYTTLASAYKIQASNWLTLHSEVDQRPREVFAMNRIGAAYSLFLAATTYQLFCLESSLIANVANFLTSAGESLVTLARNSTWVSAVSCESCPLNSPRFCRCSLLDRYEASTSLMQYGDFDKISLDFFHCFTSLSQMVWAFLSHGCQYLSMFKDPTNLCGDGKLYESSNFFEPHFVSENSGSNQYRTHTLELGVHCLIYGAYLSKICYGHHCYRTTNSIVDVLLP